MFVTSIGYFSNFSDKKQKLKVKQIILAAIFSTTLECYEPNKVRGRSCCNPMTYIDVMLSILSSHHQPQQQQPGASYILGGAQQHQPQQQQGSYHSYSRTSARPGAAHYNNYNKIKKVDPSNMSSYETNPVGALQVGCSGSAQQL